MTCNVFGGTLNLTQTSSQQRSQPSPVLLCLDDWLNIKIVYSWAVTHPSTNLARCRGQVISFSNWLRMQSLQTAWKGNGCLLYYCVASKNLNCNKNMKTSINHFINLRQAGHIFALPTASPSTSLGCGRGWAIVDSRSLVLVPVVHFVLIFVVHPVRTLLRSVSNVFCRLQSRKTLLS